MAVDSFYVLSDFNNEIHIKYSDVN